MLIYRIGFDTEHGGDFPCRKIFPDKQVIRLQRRRVAAQLQFIESLLQDGFPIFHFPAVLGFGRDLGQHGFHDLGGNGVILTPAHQVTGFVVDHPFEIIPETAFAPVIPEGLGGIEKGKHHQLDQIFLFRLGEAQITAAEQDQRLVHFVKFLPADLVAAADGGQQTSPCGKCHNTS